MEAPPWARHLPAGVDPSIVDLLAEGTLPQAWARRWAAAPRAALLHTAATGWISNSTLDERSRRAAARLRDLGLRAGDRLIVSAGPSADLVAVHVGALRSGIVVVPTNTAYTATELAHIASDSRATVAVVDDPSRVPAGVLGEDITACSADTAPPALDVSAPGDPAMICTPRGRPAAPRAPSSPTPTSSPAAEAVRLAWRWSPGDRLVLALPLFHMHGLGVGVHGTLLAGASMVLLPRFDAGAVLDAVRDHEATLFFGVPTMYSRLAASARIGELRPLRLCVSGSAPLPADLHNAISAGSGQHVLERYGMTETLMNTSNPYDGERRPGSVGIPLPGVNVRLAPGPTRSWCGDRMSLPATGQSPILMYSTTGGSARATSGPSTRMAICGSWAGPRS